MSPAHTNTSHESHPRTTRGAWPESNVTFQCRNSTRDHQPALSSFEPHEKRASRQHLRPVHQRKVSMITSGHSFNHPQLAQQLGHPSNITSDNYYLEQTRPRQATLPPTTWASDRITTTAKLRDSPIDEGDITETETYDRSGPASKRCKLSDDGWIEEALKRGQEERGAPDPYPMPVLTPPRHMWELCSHLQPGTAATQSQEEAPPRWLSPSSFGRSPATRSATLSRRPSSTPSTDSRSRSPALTHRSNTSANRRGPPSPTDDSIMCGFSDLEIGSRADSRAPDDIDTNATFSHIHNVPRVALPARSTADVSRLEQLPKQVFMRLMMYCGYKAQVLLKKCSYSLYLSVDLESVPWEEKTSTILFEERNNPRNFPKKPAKAQDGERNRADDDEETDRPKKATKQKKSRTKADSSSSKPAILKNKPHIDTYGRWGCYCCYKILPAHYFEGALLEDKEGRVPKSNKLRGADAAESDKKVDMRVEYVQILAAVPGSRLPDWLSKDKTNMRATDIEAYVREKMEKGVNCDDLRAYFRNITRETHLVAPIRGITPVFTPASVSTNLDLVAKAAKFDANVSPRKAHTPLPAMQIREEEIKVIDYDPETARPLYKLQPGNALQMDADSASYTYQIGIPRDAERDTRPLLLPETEPVSRLCLPPKNTSLQEPVLEIGDVVSLRRICIPCGTKFAVYRRNCNRKIISKTDEQWWVCDCPEVRLAGRSTGCETCGRKVIY